MCVSVATTGSNSQPSSLMNVTERLNGSTGESGGEKKTRKSLIGSVEKRGGEVLRVLKQ